MDGNEHDYQVPQNIPQPPLGGAVSAGMPGYVSQNPLQPGVPVTPVSYQAYGQAAAADVQPVVPPLATQAMASVPGGPPVSAVPASPLAVPPMPLPDMQAATPLAGDDESVPVDDVVWVNRAKRAIAETQGDPHRQVQLIQHLRSVYLKQRFGRNIHTDGK